MFAIDRHFRNLVAEKSRKLLILYILQCLLPAISIADPGSVSLVEEVFKHLPAVFSAVDSEAARDQTLRLLGKIELVVKEAATVSKRSIRAANGITDLNFQDVRLTKANISGEKLLVLSSGGNISHLENSILLVDGSIELGNVTKSVIVASGGVKIAHSDGNIILAEQGIFISFDNPLGEQSQPEYYDFDNLQKARPSFAVNRVPSLLISGSSLSISHAYGSVVSCAGVLEISHAHQILAINVSQTNISHRSGWDELTNSALKVDKREPIDLSSGKSLYFLNERNRYLVGDALKEDYLKRETLGQEYCFAGEDSFRIKIGSSVPDCCGEMTRKVKGWTVDMELEGYFLLKKGQQYATVHIEQEPVANTSKDRICRFEN